jgi:hypothetical protein
MEFLRTFNSTMATIVGIAVFLKIFGVI